MTKLALAVATVMLLPALTLAQTDSKDGKMRPPPTEPGSGVHAPIAKSHIAGEVAIGERAPDFELDGSDGKSLKLSSLRGDWVLLVFGPRKETLTPLASVVEEARTLGLKVVGVCDEKSYFLRSHAQKVKLPFVLLSDDTGEVSQVYGLYNADMRTTANGFLLLDREGIVRQVFLGQHVPPSDILRLARFGITGT